MLDKKPRQIQYDFITGSNEPRREKSKWSFTDLFKVTLNPEHIIIGLVFAIMLSLISFSLGVEKGKKIVSVQTKDEKIVIKDDVATKKKEAEPQIKEVTVKEEKPKLIEKKAPASIETKEINVDAYTIQVASFKKKSFAEKEAVRLQKYGYEIVILPKGEYVIVCVGNFQSKKEAESFSAKLKKQYNDCIIRRL